MNIQEIRQKYPQYDNLSDEDLARGLHKKYYSNMDFSDFASRIGLNQDKSSLDEKALGALTSFDTGYSAGFGRKLGGLLSAVGSYPVDRIAQLAGVENTPSFSERYGEISDTARQAQKEFSETNPVLSTALQVGGALVSPINKVGINAIKNAEGLRKAATAAGVGTGTGAIYGAGSAESISELPESVAKDAVLGAAIGGGVPLAGKTLQGVKNLGQELLGVTTGAGGRSIRQAYEAGKRGSATFLENMRGEVNKANIVDAARNKLQQMKIAKNAEYAKNMEAINTDKTFLDLKGVSEKLKEIKSDFNVGGFSKAGKSTQKAIDEVSEIVDEFAKNPEIHTVQGFDALKQRIYDINFPIEERQANSVVKQMGNAVKQEINKQAPTYAKTMKEYTEASDTIRELENALSLRSDKSYDTALRKLQSSFRNNVASNYGTRGDLVENLGGNELSDAISGQLLNDLLPRGLVGRLAGGAAAYSANVPALLASSPRLVGEASYALGRAARAMPSFDKPLQNLISKYPNATQALQNNVQYQPAVWLQLLKGEE